MPITETRPTVIWVVRAMIEVHTSHLGVISTLHGVDALWKVGWGDFARRLLSRVTYLSWFAKDKIGLFLILKLKVPYLGNP